MNFETFDVLRRHHTTSWACWSEDEDCSVEFFRSQINNLHGRAIFVGLNRSESWQGDLENEHMSNFHTPGHAGDRRLKRHIQDARLDNLIGGLLYVANKDTVSEERLTLASKWVGQIDDRLKQAAANAQILQKRLPGRIVTLSHYDPEKLRPRS